MDLKISVREVLFIIADLRQIPPPYMASDHLSADSMEVLRDIFGLPTEIADMKFAVGINVDIRPINMFSMTIVLGKPT